MKIFIKKYRKYFLSDICLGLIYLILFFFLKEGRNILGRAGLFLLAALNLDFSKILGQDDLLFKKISGKVGTFKLIGKSLIFILIFFAINFAMGTIFAEGMGRRIFFLTYRDFIYYYFLTVIFYLAFISGKHGKLRKILISLGLILSILLLKGVSFYFNKGIIKSSGRPILIFRPKLTYIQGGKLYFTGFLNLTGRALIAIRLLLLLVDVKKIMENGNE